MLRKLTALAVLTATASMVFANVDLRTNISDVFYNGTCEEAGAITMTVNGNDFSNASTESPVYIRVRLSKLAQLCQTLVGPFGTTDSLQVHPKLIYLAMRLESDSPGDVITADKDSVAIVRWRRNESEIWLRVQTSSEDWLENFNGDGILPSQNRKVSWNFGVTARASHDQNFPLWLNDDANRPGNSRPGRNDVSPTDWDDDACSIDGVLDNPVSTLLGVNLQPSFMTFVGDEAATGEEDSMLVFDTISFKYTDGTVEDRIYRTQVPTQGFQQNIQFSGDDQICRGWEVIGVTDTEKSPNVPAYLCFVPGSGQFDTGEVGLVCTFNQIEITVLISSNPFGILTYGWFHDSYAVLSVPSGAEYGFNPTQIGTSSSWRTGNVGFGTWNGSFSNPSCGSGYNLAGFNSGAVQSSDWLSTSELTNIDGYLLAPYATIRWNQDTPAGEYTFNIAAEICAPWTIDATEIQVNIDLYASNRNGAEQSLALQIDSPDSAQGISNGVPDVSGDAFNCSMNLLPKSFFVFDTIEWTEFGEFVECTGEDVAIFFPYLPKLEGTDFWSGLAIVNHGIVDFTDGNLNGVLYQADGARFTSAFPALATTNLQTWLLANGDSGIAFYGVGPHEGEVVAVTPSGNALTFGAQRSSMFVIGSFVAETYCSRVGADLDGYCLIGRELNINGSYLARNIAGPGTALQHQDLPVAIGKAIGSAVTTDKANKANRQVLTQSR